MSRSKRSQLAINGGMLARLGIPEGIEEKFARTERVGIGKVVAYMVDPHRIQRMGPYIRQWTDPEESAAFKESVDAEGAVHQPVGVRRVGDDLVLIYGSQRLDAALAAGFEEIPVREHGEISDAESLLLQLVENDARQEMHHVDRALAYYEATRMGISQKELCEHCGVDSGNMSVFCRAGEALAQLDPDDLALAYVRLPSKVFRDWQPIVKLPLADRVRRMRTLIRGRDSTSRSGTRTEKPIFSAKPLRDGRRFELRWRTSDLVRDPEAAMDEITGGIAQELANLADQIAKMDLGVSNEDLLRRVSAMIEAARG